MKTHAYFVAAAALLALAGCQSSGGSSSASQASAAPVAGGPSPDVCRAQASAQLGPSLENIETNDPVSTGSGTTIRGQWQDPNTGDTVGTFLCQFSASGKFVSVKQI